MKTNILPLAIACLPLTVFSQNIYPDGLEEPLSDRILYVENQGQLRNSDGNSADQIFVYSTGTQESSFFAPSKFHISGTSFAENEDDPNTIHRLDFQFNTEDALVYPQILEESETKLRVYNEKGFFEDLKVGSRVVYENVNHQTDVHFYSNEFGPKSSIVFKPDANPENFELTVYGHDQIIETQGYTVIQKDDYAYPIPYGYAYQVDEDGTVIPLSWQPNYIHVGGGKLKFDNLGNWNPEHTLIFQFGALSSSSTAPQYVDWCTLITTGATSSIVDLKTDNSGNLYATGYTYSSSFPVTNTAFQTNNSGKDDYFVLKFDVNHELVWSTYLGGSEDDNADYGPIETGLNQGKLLVATTTNSKDFPLLNPGGGAFFDDVNTCSPNGSSPSCKSGVIFEFSSNGQLTYSTYFGDYKSDGVLRSVEVDEENGNYFVIGNGKFQYLNPGNGAYFSTTGSGLVAQFSSQHKLLWSTSFGVSGTWIYDCEIDNSGNLIVVGFTNDDSGFPILPRTGAYNEASFSGGNFDGFIAQFNSSLEQEWTTFVGGISNDKLWKLDISEDNELVVCGHTESQSGLPISTNAAGFMQDNFGGIGSVGLDVGDGVLISFDEKRAIKKCSYFGGSSTDKLMDIESHHGRTFAIGNSASSSSTLPFPTSSPQNLYIQPNHQDGHDVNFDGIVIGFDKSSDLHWSTYLGSYGGAPWKTDILNSLEFDGFDKLYVGGIVSSQTGVPFKNPNGNAWFNNTSSGYESLICLFDLSENSALNINKNIRSERSLEIYPNPFIDNIRLIGDVVDKIKLVQVYDMQGRLLLSEQPLNNAVNLETLNSGTYIMSYTDGDVSHSQVIIKQ